ncbi:hypothetical protein CHCC20335_3665 [Bacillus paralicheniformis]|nr:hypothetical protein CHCC20335_3665 [Bacillus paralicheniformis]
MYYLTFFQTNKQAYLLYRQQHVLKNGTSPLNVSFLTQKVKQFCMKSKKAPFRRFQTVMSQ